MVLTQEELKTVTPAVQLGADYLGTHAWKRKAKVVLADLKAGRPPNIEDLTFTLGVVNSGRVNW